MRLNKNRYIINIINSFRFNGFLVTYFKIRRNLFSIKKNMKYNAYVSNNELNTLDLLNDSTNNIVYTPLISIVMPVYNVPLFYLKEAISSIRNQIYTNWELIIVDDGSNMNELRDYLDCLPSIDRRISVNFRKSNGGIVEATNDAISYAQGEFIAFMDNDDLITPDALYRIVQHLQKYADDMIYTDEDKINSSGKYVQPYFKPDWSPELLYSCNYISHLSVYRKSIGDSIGWLRKGYDGSQDYDLNLRFTEKTIKIGHVAKVLYHWRMIPGSTSKNAYAKPYAYIAACKALNDSFMRKSFDAYVKMTLPGHYQMIYRSITLPRLTVVIFEVLKEKSVLSRWYDDFEKMNLNIIIYCVSSLDELKCKMENISTSDQENGDKEVKNDLLLFVDSSIKSISLENIVELAQYAYRNDVGCVGGIIYFKNKIQDSGLVLGVSKGYDFAYRGVHLYDYAESNQLIDRRNVTAISGLMMMTKKALYQSFLKHSVSIQYYSHFIEYGVYLRKGGKFNVITPTVKAEIIKKPGYVDLSLEKSLFKNIQDHCFKDPYYNLHFDKQNASFKWIIPE